MTELEFQSAPTSFPQLCVTSSDSVSLSALRHLLSNNPQVVLSCAFNYTTSQPGTDPLNRFLGPPLSTAPFSPVSLTQILTKLSSLLLGLCETPLFCLGSSLLCPGCEVAPENWAVVRLTSSFPYLRDYSLALLLFPKNSCLVYSVQLFMVDGESDTGYSIMARSRSLL